MLFRETLRKYEKYLVAKDYADTTITGYRKELTYFNRWLEETYNGPVYLDEVTQVDLDSYLLYRKKKGDSTSSRSRIGYIFRSFYQYIAKKDLGKNIALDLEPVQPRKKERIYLSSEEMEKVLESIEKPLIQIVTFFLYNTGVRISECLNLKIENVDFKNNVIHILQGKGNKDRDIALNSKLKKKLEHYLEEVRPEVDSDYLFATERSGGLSRTYYNRRLKLAVERAGIDKEVTAHCIRHSMASALIRKGVDLPTVQRVLGHENLKTTSIYVHSDMSQMRDALEGI